jgi:hypothetical protein
MREAALTLSETTPVAALLSKVITSSSSLPRPPPAAPVEDE